MELEAVGGKTSSFKWEVGSNCCCQKSSKLTSGRGKQNKAILILSGPLVFFISVTAISLL